MGEDTTDGRTARVFAGYLDWRRDENIPAHDAVLVRSETDSASIVGRWRFGEIMACLFEGADVEVSMYSTAADRARPGTRPDDGEGLVVGLVVSGAMQVTQDHRSVLVPAGRVVFYDGVTSCGLRAEEPHRYLVVYVRGQLLRIRPEDREALIARDLSRLAAGKTLAALLGSIAQGAMEPSFGAGLHLGDAIVSCVRAVVAEVRGGGVGDRSDVLFGELAEWLDERLADKDLSTESLAAHHYLSARYVRKLFADHATTVVAYIRQRRLERIRDDLMQPWCADLPVSVIAARWGFKDPSVFSRAFTRQFGQGPQRFRKEVAAREER